MMDRPCVTELLVSHERPGKAGLEAAESKPGWSVHDKRPKQGQTGVGVENREAALA